MSKFFSVSLLHSSPDVYGLTLYLKAAAVATSRRAPTKENNNINERKSRGESAARASQQVPHRGTSQGLSTTYHHDAVNADSSDYVEVRAIPSTKVHTTPGAVARKVWLTH